MMQLGIKNQKKEICNTCKWITGRQNLKLTRKINEQQEEHILFDILPLSYISEIQDKSLTPKKMMVTFNYYNFKFYFKSILKFKCYK